MPMQRWQLDKGIAGGTTTHFGDIAMGAGTRIGTTSLL